MDFGKDIKRIIFDLDGTLINLDIDWYAVKNKLGIEQSESLQTFIENADEVKRRQVYDLLDKAEIEGFKFGFNDKVVEQLERLCLNYELIIFSRNSERVINEFLAKASPTLAEKITVIGRKVGIDPKPNIGSLVQKCNIDMNTVVIGDTSHDVEVAKKIGSPCIIIRNKKNKYTPKGADYYVDSLTLAIQNLMEGR